MKTATKRLRTNEPVPIEIRGVKYPTIIAAARAFMVASSTISRALEKGRLDEIGIAPLRNAPAMQVTVNGTTYDSLAAAAAAQDMPRFQLLQLGAEGKLDVKVSREVGPTKPAKNKSTEAFEMFQSGMSIDQVAEKLGIPRPVAYRRISNGKIALGKPARVPKYALAHEYEKQGLSVKETADRLGVNVQAAYMLIRRGRLRARSIKCRPTDTSLDRGDVLLGGGIRQLLISMSPEVEAWIVGQISEGMTVSDVLRGIIVDAYHDENPAA